MFLLVSDQALAKPAIFGDFIPSFLLENSFSTLNTVCVGVAYSQQTCVYT